MNYANLCTFDFNKDQVLIAISKSSFDGGHIGICFHSSKNGPKILHLAWHKRLQYDSIPKGLTCCWIAFPLPVPTSVSKVIVALARTVGTRGPQINYGINLIAARGSFSSNGSYKPPKGSDGLTCATFIVEILRAGCIDIVNSEDWRAHDKNVSWANAVCNFLANSSDCDSHHLDAVRRNINGLRLRPFEVAGAASLGVKSWPAKFDDVQIPAQNFADDLSNVCVDIESCEAVNGDEKINIVSINSVK